MPRIVFSACPMYGHVNTILPLAMAARRAGHDVVVATGPDMVAHVERYGLVAWPVGPTHHEAGGGSDADWLRYFATSAEKRATDLVPRAARWRPDLVVSEETELAGPVAAAAAGARHVVHGLGLMPSMGIWQALGPAVQGLYGRFRIPLNAGGLRDATYLEICPPAMRPRRPRASACPRRSTRCRSPTPFTSRSARSSTATVMSSRPRSRACTTCRSTSWWRRVPAATRRGSDLSRPTY